MSFASFCGFHFEVTKVKATLKSSTTIMDDDDLLHRCFKLNIWENLHAYYFGSSCLFRKHILSSKVIGTLIKK